MLYVIAKTISPTYVRPNASRHITAPGPQSLNSTTDLSLSSVFCHVIMVSGFNPRITPTDRILRVRCDSGETQHGRNRGLHSPQRGSELTETFLVIQSSFDPWVCQWEPDWHNLDLKSSRPVQERGHNYWLVYTRRCLAWTRRGIHTKMTVDRARARRDHEQE